MSELRTYLKEYEKYVLQRSFTIVNKKPPVCVNLDEKGEELVTEIQIEAGRLVEKIQKFYSHLNLEEFDDYVITSEEETDF